MKNRIMAKSRKNAANPNTINEMWDEAAGPGSEYQIGDPVADIPLVDESRNYLIGRPTLYLVMDRFSGLIAGVHLTFDEPNFIEAAAAIWNGFEDKVRQRPMSFLRRTGRIKHG